MSLDTINFSIKYFDKNQNYVYELSSFLGCNLLKELYYMERDTNEPIELREFHDIFKALYYNQDFVYDVDRTIKDEKYDDEYYDNKQLEHITHIIQGLSYFNSDRLFDVFIEIQNYFYCQEKTITEHKFIDFFCKKKTKVTDIIYQNSLLSVNSLKKIGKVYANKLVLNPEISIEYLENYAGKIQNDDWWCGIAQNTTIPVELFEKYIEHYIDHTTPRFWGLLSSNPSIPVEFFQKYKDKIDLREIEMNPSISPHFLEQFLDRIDWANVSGNFSLTVDFFEKYQDKPLNWERISNNPNIPFSFFRDHIPNPPRGMFCSSPNTPIDFFARFTDSYDYDDWELLCENPSITVDFIEQNLANVNWSALSRNKNIPIEFFEQNIEKVDWSELYKNPSIPPDFYEKYMDSIDYTPASLYRNPSFPIDFFENNFKVSIYSNNFSVYIENKVKEKLRKINILLTDKIVELNTIILHCLTILSNENITRSMLFLSKLRIPKYLLLANTALYSKNVFTQIKHFLCLIKQQNKYKDEIADICNIIHEKEILNPLWRNEKKEEREPEREEERKEDKTVIPKDKKMYDNLSEFFRKDKLTVELFNEQYNKIYNDMDPDDPYHPGDMEDMILEEIISSKKQNKKKRI